MEVLIDEIFSGKNVVVVTGAGISTLSGIPDFRGQDGLYTKNSNVEKILSKTYFESNSNEFYEFYKNNMIMKNVYPNIIHHILAKLEEMGYVSCIITQNIDNLHQKAGSKNVVDVHGNSEEFYCSKCNKNYDVDYYLDQGYLCAFCNGIVRPNIVLYGECIETYKSWLLKEKIYNADVVIVLGSSLVVSTVADVIRDYTRLMKFNKTNPKSLFIINNQPTPFDYYAQKSSEDLELVFQKIKKKIK